MSFLAMLLVKSADNKEIQDLESSWLNSWRNKNGLEIEEWKNKY